MPISAGAYKGLRHGFSSRCIDCHSVQLCGSRQLRGHQHQGTLNMCQAARDEGIDRLIVTSTSEVYGTAQYVPIPETHPRQPQSPYSATKIGADAIALSFYNAFELPVVVARPFNTYGPRQSARAIIPTIISQIASGMRTIKVGDLTPTRDFNFVEDTCRGFIALANAENIEGKEINIATALKSLWPILWLQLHV